MNGLRQHSTGESLHVQILDGDHAVVVDQLRRQLVLEVPPLIADVSVRPLQQPDRLAPAVVRLFFRRATLR